MHTSAGQDSIRSNAWGVGAGCSRSGRPRSRAAPRAVRETTARYGIRSMYFSTRRARLTVACVAAVLVLALGPAIAADPAQHRIADGIAVYLGVLPAEMIQGHGKAHAESGMHGGPRAGEHVYHVMVALFESDTGERIGDAEVRARVSELGLAGSEMPLEPMSIAGTVTY